MTVVAISLEPARASRVAPALAEGLRALTAHLPGTGSWWLLQDERLLVLSDRLPDGGGAIGLTPGHDRPHRPPWAGLRVLDHRVEARTDPLGFMRLHVHRAPGWAGLSTSALALGALAGVEEDPVSTASMALLGHLIGTRTRFRGVTRVGGARDVVLAGGDVVDEPVPVAHPDGPGDGLAAAVRQAVAEDLDAHDGAWIELSGGLDSRLILAAMPPSAREGRTAITIGDDDDDDVVVARDVARRTGLDHAVVRRDQVGRDPADALARVRDAAAARDCAGDPVAGAVLDAVGRCLPAGPRFSGVGGEIARAFYTTGVPGDPPVGRAAVRALLTLRMTTNHRIADGLLVPTAVAEMHELISRAVLERLHEHGRTATEATDGFYLHDRLPGWAGVSYSWSASRQPVLAPLLSPAFVAAARALPRRQRRGSRGVARALSELDAALATVPLAGGGAPGAGTPARLLATSLKVEAKLRQRVTGTRRPPSGTAVMARLAASALTDEELAAAVVLLPGAALGSRAADVQLDAATLGFLVNGVVAGSAVQAVARAMADPPRAMAAGEAVGGPGRPDGWRPVGLAVVR